MSQVSVTVKVADRIRGLRVGRHWSAQRLADECARAGMPSLTRSTIAKIESGVRKAVTVDELAVLARVLDVPVDDLVGSGLEVRASVAPGIGVVGSAGLPNAADLPTPRGINDLPLRRGLFVGREAELAQLDAVPDRPGAVVVQVLHGLGGIGKSTLAAQWAARNSANHTLIRWIHADDASAVQAGLAALAVALQPALAGPLPTAALAEYALQWLAGHSGWLLVLDDVADLGAIAPILSRPTEGRVLITSRVATGWHQAGAETVLRLGVLTAEESVRLLTRGADLAETRGVFELCEALGGLPLAVEQAASYLAENPLVRPGDYLAMLTDHTTALLGQESVGVPVDRTVDRIWRVTIAHLAGEPLATEILRILAWYHSDGIPASLLDGIADPPTLSRAIGRLSAYSLLTVDPVARTVAMHRLFQALARASVETARDQAIGLLLAHLPPEPNDPAGWPTWRALLPHVETLAKNVSPEHDTAELAELLGRCGVFLTGQGQLAPATKYLERAVADFEDRLGPDHPHSLGFRRALADAYWYAGDIGLAVPMFEQAVTDHERVFGTDHRRTLAARTGLASTYEAGWDAARAVALWEQVLADSERILGPEHPDTLAARRALARSRHTAGDPAGAAVLLTQAVADSARVLGPDHPDTLAARRGQARAMAAVGEAADAVGLLTTVVADSERVLGPDHPDTLIARRGLARAMGKAGNPAGAADLLVQVLADTRRVLGLDHPDTFTAQRDLAHAFEAAGDPARAANLLTQTLADAERVLGPDHPGALIVRRELAQALGAAGAVEQAVPLLQRVLVDATRVLGPEHPETEDALRSLTVAGASASPVTAADWQEVVDEYNPLVWSIIHSFRLPEADAKDVAQSTWLKLTESIDRVKDPEQLAPWLVHVTRREALKVVRSRRRAEVPGVDLTEIPDNRTDTDPEAAAVSEDERQELWQALSTLSPRCRDLLRILAITPGDSYSKVAEALGMSIGSIGPTRSRCLEQLKRALASARR